MEQEHASGPFLVDEEVFLKALPREADGRISSDGQGRQWNLVGHLLRAYGRDLTKCGEPIVPASDSILTIAETSRRIANGDTTPVDVLERYLARIDAVDDKIHSYVHVDRVGSRAAARGAAAEIAGGRWRGPLHGLPFAVKDNYDVANMPATAGSKLRLGSVPTSDAELVRRLKAAGAILVGKLSTWEYGTGNGGEYFDLPFPPARNPWDTERFTGGSSTGAGTSVAAGTAMFALGSDTTGSVRLPAAATGTVGIIPTPGRLSLDGILPNCFSLDNPGPFTWTVEDSAIVLEALVDRMPRDPRNEIGFRRATGGGIAGMRIAVVRDPGEGMPSADAPLAKALDEAVNVIEELGAKITDVVLPIPTAQCFNVTRIIGPAESAAIHERELRERPGEMGFALRDKLMAGSMLRAVDYITAQRQRLIIANAIDALVRGFDALVTFGALHLPPRLGVEPEMTAFTVDTMLTPFNLSAHPAMIQCTGFSAEGLPLHWQLVGNRGDEASLYRLAAAYEGATAWRQRRPVL
ncbi:MAG: amidase [Hyphomicrobiaceae bacterium]